MQINYSHKLNEMFPKLANNLKQLKVSILQKLKNKKLELPNHLDD